MLLKGLKLGKTAIDGFAPILCLLPIVSSSQETIPSLGKISLNQIPKGYIPVPSDIQLSSSSMVIVGVVGVEPVEYGQINMKRHKVIFLSIQKMCLSGHIFF